MSVIVSVEQSRRWTEIHDMLGDLLQNPGTLDAKTDTFYKLVWGDKE